MQKILTGNKRGFILIGATPVKGGRFVITLADNKGREYVSKKTYAESTARNYVSKGQYSIICKAGIKKAK